jgi:hypothetical protein
VVVLTENSVAALRPTAAAACWSLRRSPFRGWYSVSRERLVSGISVPSQETEVVDFVNPPYESVGWMKSAAFSDRLVQGYAEMAPLPWMPACAGMTR